VPPGILRSMSLRNRKVDASTGDDADAVDEDSFEEEEESDPDDSYEDSYEEDDSYEDEDEDEDEDDQDYDDDEDVEEQEEEEERPETQEERRKRLLAARAAGQPAAVKPAQTTTSTKRAIDRLDARETRFSFIAAVASALFGILIYVTETQNHNFRLAKNQFTPQTTLIVGLVGAALLVGVTVLNRRALVGFVALITGFSFAQSSYFWGAPFLVLAVWLLVRSYRVQKEASAKLRAARGAGGGSARARPSPASRPAAPVRPSAAAARRGPRSKGPAVPAGNKRYTPKRQAPPPPKPSRRQRKASASD
jgi:hypothetical protein